MEIVLLLREGKNTADHTLDVFQSVATQFAGSDLIQPALDVVRPRVFQPDLRAERLKMVFPDVPIAFRSGRPFVFFNPR